MASGLFESFFGLHSFHRVEATRAHRGNVEQNGAVTTRWNGELGSMQAKQPDSRCRQRGKDVHTGPHPSLASV